MSPPAVDAPPPTPTLVAIVAQVVLLAGIGLYALRADWASSATGLLTVLGGPVVLIAGSAAWWRWGSRAPLVIADIWLGVYGSSVLLLFGMADAGGGSLDLSVLVLGLMWLAGGVVGAVAVWRARR